LSKVYPFFVGEVGKVYEEFGAAVIEFTAVPPFELKVIVADVGV
jgi:hypothetical protein